MENKKVKNENYFQVNGFMVNELHLKGIPLMVYAIIYGFTQDGETQFEGSRQYLCDFTGVSKPTIDKALNELCDSNLIIKISEIKNNITFNKFKVNLNMLNFTTSKETLSVGGKETLPNNNNLDNIDINNKDKNIHIKENNIKENCFDNIFNYWNEKGIIKHKEPNEAMKNAYKKAVKKYNVSDDDIKVAIDHYKEMYDDKNCWISRKYNLETFLSQGNLLVNFLNDGSWWNDYKSKKEEEAPRLNIGLYCR